MKIRNLKVFLNVLLIFNFFAVASCQVAKKTTSDSLKTPPPSIQRLKSPLELPTAPSAGYVLRYLSENALQVSWLSTDADIEIRGPMNVGAGSTLRMRRDSVIWINVTKIGFGVARAQVTPKEVTLINYIQNYYVQEPLAFIEQKLGLPADFGKLQDILLGNAVFLNGLTDSTSLTFTKTADGGAILGGSPKTNFQATYKFNEQMQLVEMSFVQPTLQREVTFYYEDFNPLRDKTDKTIFAFKRRIFAKSAETGIVEVMLEAENPMEIDVPKKIKFEIPSSYKRMTIKE
jgi:hypothetical protein